MSIQTSPPQRGNLYLSKVQHCAYIEDPEDPQLLVFFFQWKQVKLFSSFFIIYLRPLIELLLQEILGLPLELSQIAHYIWRQIKLSIKLFPPEILSCATELTLCFLKICQYHTLSWLREPSKTDSVNFSCDQTHFKEAWNKTLVQRISARLSQTLMKVSEIENMIICF